MGDLSEHFSRREFVCRCGCGTNKVQPRLVQVLQAIRDHFDLPVIVQSGTRCRAHNTRVGGAKASQHLLGKAADIRIDGISPPEIARFAATLLAGSGGIKPYPTFCHVDVRAGYWRG